MSNPNPPAPRSRARTVLLGTGWLALALYGFFLARHFSGVAGGADSSGYLNSARLIASGHLTAELRVPPEFGPQAALLRQQFQPHGFAPFEGNPRLSPTYAVGLPLHLALAGKIVGWSLAPGLVGVLAALAAVGLTYAVARELDIDPALASAGAATLAAYPVFIFMSIQPLSDTVATTWCLAAILTALRAQRRSGWAIACGAAVGMAVLVRMTNALIIPAVAILIGWHPRRLALAAAGGVPAALWLGYYNHALYGSALRTGYVNISEAFGWAYGAPTVVHFAQWLALMLPTVLLVLPLVALARRARSARISLALVLWFGAFTGVYAFYQISHEVWWDLRFILPGTPALIIGGLLGVEAVVRSAPARATCAAGLALWAAGLAWFWTHKHHLLLTQTYEQAYADASAAARENFPAEALVVAGQHSGAIYYYTGFAVLRWEFVNAAEFAHFRTLAEKAGRPICALLYDTEEKEALRERCLGHWTQVAKLNNIALWRLEASKP